MGAHYQRQIDAIDLELPRLKAYEPERYAKAVMRRLELVRQQTQLSRLEIEIMNRAAMRFQPRQTEQVFPTGEEGFRCRNCQRLSRTLYCHFCKREGQDWAC